MNSECFFQKINVCYQKGHIQQETKALTKKKKSKNWL